MTDIPAIAHALLPRLEELCRDLLPGGKRMGREYKCGSLQGGDGTSCSVNLATGQWADFATGQKGGDGVSLIAQRNGLNQREAADYAAEKYGLNGVANPGSNGHKSPWKVLPCADVEAPVCTGQHHQWGQPSRDPWTYHTSEGKVAFMVFRYDPPGEKKQFCPWTWCEHSTGRRAWQPRLYSKPLPLYNLHLLKDHTGPVLLTEGEKAADAAQALFPDHLVMTWQGGAKNVGNTDWGPLKDHPDVTIWRDNDAPGLSAQQDIAFLLPKAKAVKLPDTLPEGWDLADPMPDGIAITDLVAQSTPAKERIPTHSIKSILNAVIDHNHYRLGDGLLGRKEILVFAGVGGVGKTRVVTDLSLASAAGLDKWFTLPLRGGPTRWLFIGSETSVARLQFDLGVLLPKLSPEHRAIAEQNIEWYIPDDDLVSEGGFIDNPKSKARLVAVVKQFSPDVIVLDTLVSLTSVLDLNKDVDMNEAVTCARVLMAAGNPGCSGIIIHHARPGSENIVASLNQFNKGAYAKNSKVLASRSRGEIDILPGDSEDDSRIILTVGKVNNGRPFEPFGLKFSIERGYDLDADFDIGTYKDDVGGERTGNSCTKMDVMLAIDSGDYNRKDIVQTVKEATQAAPRTIDRRIKEAKKDGYIEPCEPFGSYILTDKGLAWLRKNPLKKRP